MFKPAWTILSSIKIKLFLWFWLVTIISIGATRFISGQLSNEQLRLPPDPMEMKRLERISFLANKIAADNINDFISDLSQRRRHNSVKLKKMLVKQVNNNSVVVGEYPKANKFIVSQDFSRPFSWQIGEQQLTGPLTLQFGDSTYQLFLIRDAKPPRHLGIYIMQLPTWARVAIPLAISFLLSWLLARSLSQPISKIATAAKAFGEGNYSSRVTGLEKRTDELGVLAADFNGMATKIAANVSAQQRLLGDVSHELRSPLTRLQMALALAESKKHSLDEQQNYLERCQLEVERLDAMISDVLSLSRLENMLTEHHFSPIKLTTLLHTVIDDAQFIAQAKQVIITLIECPELTINADSQLMASALGNIINNAVKYSPNAGEVNIKVTKLKDRINITVCDQGEGVPEASLNSLFKPFYRVGSARDRATGGTGLGLAIAHQAVVVHQGEIRAENTDNGGLKITIDLPLKN